MYDKFLCVDYLSRTLIVYIIKKGIKKFIAFREEI